MPNFNKETYEVYLKNGMMYTSVAPNRGMAVVFVVQDRLGGKDAEIDYVVLQGGKRKLKYPFKKKLDLTSRKHHDYNIVKNRKKILLGAGDEFAPPLPGHPGSAETPVEEAEEGPRTWIAPLAPPVMSADPSLSGDPMKAGSFSGPMEIKVHNDETGGSMDELKAQHQAELEELRERLSQNGSDELKKTLEYFQGMFTDEMRGIISSNEHLRQENAELRKKMLEGATLTILPGGHVILIYGGRVLELSDLPSPPKGD